MPDATGLELIAQRVRDEVSDDAVVGTSFYREQATLEVAPARVHDVLAHLKSHPEEPFEFLSTVYACDYLPEEPRLGVHYQLLSMTRVDRLGVKTRVGVEDPARAERRGPLAGRRLPRARGRSTCSA